MRLHNWNYVVRLVSGKTQIQCLVTRKDCIENFLALCLIRNSPDKRDNALWSKTKTEVAKAQRLENGV